MAPPKKPPTETVEDGSHSVECTLKIQADLLSENTEEDSEQKSPLVGHGWTFYIPGLTPEISKTDNMTSESFSFEQSFTIPIEQSLLEIMGRKCASISLLSDEGEELWSYCFHLSSLILGDVVLERKLTKKNNIPDGMTEFYFSITLNKRLLLDEHIKAFEPVCVSVVSVSPLPDEPLNLKELSKRCLPVYCCYKMFGQKEVTKTQSFPHSSSIRFLDNRVFFFGDVEDRNSLQKKIQTEKFRVELHDRDVEVVEPEKDDNDAEVEKSEESEEEGKEMKKGTQVFQQHGFSEFDLSFLLSSEMESRQERVVSVYRGGRREQPLDATLPPGHYTACGTCLKIRIRKLGPILQSDDSGYQRLFLRCDYYDPDFVKAIFEDEVQSYNEKVVESTKSENVPIEGEAEVCEEVKKEEEANEEEQEAKEEVKIISGLISGFEVTDGYERIIYLEAENKTEILRGIAERLHRLVGNFGGRIVVFNRGLKFTSLLYPPSSHRTAVKRVRIRAQFSEILQDSRTFTGRNTSEACRSALMKLQGLRAIERVLEAVELHLFMTIEELRELEKNFGKVFTKEDITGVSGDTSTSASTVEESDDMESPQGADSSSENLRQFVDSGRMVEITGTFTPVQKSVEFFKNVDVGDKSLICPRLFSVPELPGDVIIEFVRKSTMKSFGKPKEILYAVMGIVNSVSLPNSQNMYFKVEAIEIRECASAALFTNNQGYLREKAALTKTRNRQDFVEQNRIKFPGERTQKNAIEENEEEVYMYSSQRLCTTERLAEELREKIRSAGTGAHFSYSKEFLSGSVPAVNDREIEASTSREVRKSSWMTENGFSVIKARDPAEFAKHSEGVDASRAEDLRQPWVEPKIPSALKKIDVSKVPKSLRNRPDFRLSARQKSELFDSSPEFLRSVHLIGDEEVKHQREMQESNVRQWEKKLVTDSNFYVRQRGAGVDVLTRKKGMLHDPPSKLSLKVTNIEDIPDNVLASQRYVDPCRIPMTDVLRTETMHRSGLIVSIGSMKTGDTSKFLHGDFVRFKRPTSEFVYKGKR